MYAALVARKIIQTDQPRRLRPTDRTAMTASPTAGFQTRGIQSTVPRCLRIPAWKGMNRNISLRIVTTAAPV